MVLQSEKFKQPAAAKNNRLILDPGKPQNLEVYADSNFSRNWHNPTALKDVSTKNSVRDTRLCKLDDQSYGTRKI